MPTIVIPLQNATIINKLCIDICSPKVINQIVKFIECKIFKVSFFVYFYKLYISYFENQLSFHLQNRLNTIKEVQHG